MKLGDFFNAGPKARPINPRPITFTAVSRGTVLPNGQGNPHQVPIGARVTAAMIFIGGDGGEQARTEARKSLMDRFSDKKTGVAYFTDDDWWVELNYQIIYRALREWDEKEQRLGDRLFSSMEEARELIEIRESNRIVAAYNAYVAEEHPADPDSVGKVEGVDPATFRGSQV